MRGAERVFDSSACGRIFILNKKKKKRKRGNQIRIYEKKKKKRLRKIRNCCNEIGSGFRLKIEVTRYLIYNVYLYRITSRGKILVRS